MLVKQVTLNVWVGFLSVKVADRSSGGVELTRKKNGKKNAIHQEIQEVCKTQEARDERVE